MEAERRTPFRIPPELWMQPSTSAPIDWRAQRKASATKSPIVPERANARRGGKKEGGGGGKKETQSSG